MATVATFSEEQVHMSGNIAVLDLVLHLVSRQQIKQTFYDVSIRLESTSWCYHIMCTIHPGFPFDFITKAARQYKQLKAPYIRGYGTIMWTRYPHKRHMCHKLQTVIMATSSQQLSPSLPSTSYISIFLWFSTL